MQRLGLGGGIIDRKVDNIQPEPLHSPYEVETDPSLIERILIVSDAWHPQVNGVVRTLQQTVDQLKAWGHHVLVIGPDQFYSIPCPTYPEIRLTLFPGARIRQLLKEFEPTAIHIATEGPLGWSARRVCKKDGLPFTTAYHTRFPDYVKARFGVPLRWTYAILRRFHQAGQAMMVSTDTLVRELGQRGFGNIKIWSRGVESDRFHPDQLPALELPKPVFVYVGRVAVEKNLPAFLDLDLPGSKLVVGDGPMLPELKKRYPDAHFVGAKHGQDLARHYAVGDVFVFPSKTDTFGLVVLEALASGLPVAAFPVPGPMDVIGGSGVGVLSDDLKSAALKALSISKHHCRQFAINRSWPAATAQFLKNLVSMRRINPA